MADDRLVVDQVVRFAFVLRLISLLLVLFTPGEVTDSPAWVIGVGFVTVTSALGLYRTSTFARNVATHPILLVVDVLVATVLAYVLGSESPLLLYALSTAVLIGILLPLRPAIAVLSVLVAANALVAVEQAADVAIMTTFLVPVAFAAVGALGSLTRHLLESTVRQQRRARMLGIDAARERERARLAREMHDSVAKSLHGISMAAAALPTWAAQRPAELPQRARELQEAAEVAARDARGILVGLRTDIDDRTLAEQVRSLASDLDQGGIQTDFSMDGVDDCAHEVKRELVAIAGEAVENIRRHADARHVAITCAGTAGQIIMTIRDDGRGFDPDGTRAGHFGVAGMYERAETIGAELSVSSVPRAGTTVTVRTPRTTDRVTT